MALRKHLQGLALITRIPALEYRVRQYFALGSDHLFVELRLAGLHQADVVLALMRIGTNAARRIAESLIGRSITVAPACKFLWRVNGALPSVGRQPMITWVTPKFPALRASKLAKVVCEFRVGRTLEQLRNRGVTRWDIRRAAARGWIHVTE